MTLEELQQLFPSASADTWHEHGNGGGRVQNTVAIDASVFVGIDCIVSGNARVSGSARVSGNAWVSGNARVSGNAWVSGNAQVSGNAWVSGDAWEISPLQIMGTKHFVTVGARGYLQIGCMKNTIEWWRKHYRGIGRSEGYSAAQVKEYRNYIELARVWMKIHNREALPSAVDQKEAA